MLIIILDRPILRIKMNKAAQNPMQAKTINKKVENFLKVAILFSILNLTLIYSNERDQHVKGLERI